MLREAGIPHIAAHPGLEDSDLSPGRVTPAQWVASLAMLKASAGLTQALATGEPPPLILGADTTCVADGRLIGTPASAEEAREMIRRFVDREHEVISGVALLTHADGAVRTREMFAVGARVRLGPLGDAEIDRYIETGEWKGKAGGYNLSERLAAGWPLTFDGDPTAIMGLPMRALAPRLETLARRHRHRADPAAHAGSSQAARNGGSPC